MTEFEQFEHLFKTQPKTFYARLIDATVNALLAIQDRLDEHIENRNFEAFKFELECRRMFREELTDYDHELFRESIC